MLMEQADEETRKTWDKGEIVPCWSKRVLLDFIEQ